MTTEPCPHPTFATQVDITHLEDNGVWMADIRISCIACDEPFRFAGVPVGAAVTAPMVSMDGTELRAPIEPLSAQAKRESRVPAYQRYALEVRRSIQRTAGGELEVTDLLAHDRWHLSEACAAAVDALEEVTYKSAIPSAYHLCPVCSATRLAQGDEGAAVGFAFRELARQDAVKGSTFASTPEAVAAYQENPRIQTMPARGPDEPPAAIVGATPVIPLDTQPGDDDGEDQQRAEGQPAPAQAAVFIAPSTGADDDTENPAGTAVLRERGTRNSGGGRGGRNR